MSEPFLGQIVMFGGNFAPRSWAFCDGQLLPISSNTALFSILGTTYGGDGRTTFSLPDLRGRSPIHPGAGPGLSTYQLGQKGGVEKVYLTAAEMPSHNHVVQATNAPGDQGGPGGKLLAAGLGDETIYHNMPPSENLRDMSTSMIKNAGNSQPHTNIHPFQTVNFIIALQGIFPSRS